MSVAYELSDAIASAEKQCYHLDDRYWADIYERRDRIHLLTRQGLPADEIGEKVGMTPRNVTRVRSLPAAPEIPCPPDPKLITDQRAAELEQVAHVAMELACRLRDENPAITWISLLQLDHRALLELTFVLLAGFPTDRPVSELYGWVTALPAAQDES